MKMKHRTTKAGSVKGKGGAGQGWLRAIVLSAPFWVGCASVRPVDDVIRKMTPETTHAEAVPQPVVAPSTEQGTPSPPVAPSLAAPSTLPPRTDLRSYTDAALEEYDRLCRDLLERARAEDADYDHLMEAARALAFNADLRIQSDLAFRFDPADLPQPGALIDRSEEHTSELQSLE